VSSYAKKAPELLILVQDTTQSLRRSLDVVISTMPQETAEILCTMMDSATARLSELPLWASGRALAVMTAFAKASPDGLLFVCTAVISLYFFSLYYEDMGQFFLRQLSDSARQRLSLVGNTLRHAAGAYLKVQCILSGVTFLILLTAFTLMGIEDRLPAAAAIAVIDALPILGAGAVLLPWALIALLLGRVPRALGVLTIYGILLVVHNILQAKLMGSRLGLHPVAALVSLYAGWQLAGLWGMIGLPVACVVLCSLNSSGVIRLYQ
jgi:sporulation integral membrane protein YtvI